MKVSYGDIIDRIKEIEAAYERRLKPEVIRDMITKLLEDIQETRSMGEVTGRHI